MANSSMIGVGVMSRTCMWPSVLYQSFYISSSVYMFLELILHLHVFLCYARVHSN